MFKRLCTVAFVGAISFVLTTAAHAAVFVYEDYNARSKSNKSAGKLSNQLVSVVSTYDDESELFMWDVQLKSKAKVDGFWLVVNNGPNPKKADVNELAIMYGDLDKGVVSTYAYNGKNGPDSINDPGELLQTDSIDVAGKNFKFEIDASDINSWAGWDTPSAGSVNGIGFDDKIGIWFHVMTRSKFSYNGGGDIVGLDGFKKQGWYDLSNKTTTTIVAEPGTVALFGLGLLGLGLTRRRRQ